MRLRQEQIVFVVVLVVLAPLAYKVLTDSGSSARGRPTPEPAELTHYRAPDLAVVRPDGGPAMPLSRDLLSPPSDTRPLPLLGMVEPPRRPLASLFPPPEPGPAPPVYSLLRREIPAPPSPDAFASLFAEVDTGLGDVDYDDFELFRDPNAKAAAPSLIEDVQAAVAAAAEQDPFAGLTAQEAALLIKGYKEHYDWYWDKVRTAFGRIQNKDRFGLKTDPSRAGEALVFVELLPTEGGREKFPGLDPLMIERERIAEWDFAGTFANKIEVRRRELGAAISRSTYDDAMALAQECVRGRLEAPRALAIAEELFRACSAFDPKDPAPRLGLARCFEAGFEFEKAFDEYDRLLADFGHRAEVHARLGALEARFFLFEQAEKRLRHAVAVNRGSWEAQWELGRFLAARGRPAEAVEHLRAANDQIPAVPELVPERVAVRVDLASAHVALGDVAEARSLFARALALDATNQRARAGATAAALLVEADGLNGSSDPSDAAPEAVPALSAEDAKELQPGLELFLARGLTALAEGDLAAAKDQLEAAALADPLRANLAWRALSYVAEAAGFPEEARRYVDMALECDPTDPWALYQAGRLFALDEDFASAREAFLKALEKSLDFVDALAALGEMSFKMGAFEDAERFLARAVDMEPDRVDLHGLRGLNFLLLESPPDARASFDAGAKLDRNDPVCRAGLAWCIYLSGDTEQALVALRELDDTLRARPEDDPMRVWTRNNIERIQDHETKVEWSDTFERRSLGGIWSYRESAGPVHAIVDGEATVEGTFNSTGASILYREVQAPLFVSAEADVWIDPATKADVGLFLARERQRGTSTETLARVSIMRHHDGSLQVGVIREGQSPEIIDMQEPFPTDRWVRLRIERTGDEADSRVTLLADGVPLIENAQMAALRSSTEILVGFMSEGEPGRQVRAKLDNFKLVSREALKK